MNVGSLIEMGVPSLWLFLVFTWTHWWLREFFKIGQVGNGPNFKLEKRNVLRARLNCRSGGFGWVFREDFCYKFDLVEGVHCGSMISCADVDCLSKVIFAQWLTLTGQINNFQQMEINSYISNFELCFILCQGTFV